ncbi:hypothetical protein BKP35_01055 [Anaerobacillus arseniciselenatis]|uniref:Methionine aminopeptidase n=1 Tax=Anaerobacillus arseniciselenatis TaxID=85682 RepID=A0A1S2LSW3_9BACI|nr:hypothetical protein [Anaerobacillus arseniciselenatis]OIJ15611.1 hypothetical protein BKP35_01055 [Anaerobacillus arseniciselenatis]
MGIIKAFLDWQSANYEKKVAKMKEQGLCPDCRGRGHSATAANAYVYLPSYHYRCYSCNGSGAFSDWENITH